jgi:hypothetical protein
MSRLAKIGTALVTAALLIAAKQALPSSFSTDSAARPADSLPAVPDDMVRTLGPTPQWFVEDYILG